MTNLYFISDLAEQSIPSGYYYPPTFSSLVERTKATNGNAFVCPKTGHKAGEMGTVTQWTDYIYVGNLFCTLMDSRVPMVICPPEHHGGQYGYVAFIGGDVHKLPASDIRRLVEEPWCLATKLPSHQLDELKSLVVVQVPDSLDDHYPKAYKAGAAAAQQLRNSQDGK